jgi:hypothetical protein
VLINLLTKGVVGLFLGGKLETKFDAYKAEEGFLTV